MEKLCQQFYIDSLMLTLNISGMLCNISQRTMVRIDFKNSFTTNFNVQAKYTLYIKPSLLRHL